MDSFNILRAADRLEALFNHEQAIQELQKIPATDSQFLATQFRIAKLNRKKSVELDLSSTNWTVVWQNGLDGKGGKHGPGSIVRNIVESIRTKEFVDDSDDTIPHQHAYRYISPYMIVVDHVINSIESINYYLTAARRGAKIILIHLADENYTDLHCIYDACELIYRNYWSEPLSKHTKIKHFPLGDFSSLEFPDIDYSRPAQNRSYLWNFVGDPNKQDRNEAINAFEGLTPRFVYTVDGFFDEKKLSPRAYREILADSIFTLAPRGWTNVDTFRFWEALEFGSIPIVVGNDARHYFNKFFLPEPETIPIFENWSDARQWVTYATETPAHLALVSNSVRSQWKRLKSRVISNFRADFSAVVEDLCNVR